MAGFDDIKGTGSLLGDRGEDLLKRRSDRINQKTKKEVQNVKKMADNLKEIDEVTNRLEMAFEDRINRLTQLNTSIEEMKRQQQQSLQSRTQTANNQFQKQLGQTTNMQAQRSDISQLANSSSLYGQSYGLANKYGTPELEQAMMHGQRQLQKQNARALSAAENIDDPESQTAFRKAMSDRDRSMRDIARARQAIDIQRKQGLDLPSQHRRGMSIVSGIQNHAEKMQLREDVSSGKVKRNDVEEKLSRVTEQLIKSFNGLDKAVSSNANNAGKLALEFNEVASQYNRHAETLKEMDRQGIGPGGSGGNGAAMRGMLGGFGNMMNGGSQIIGAVAQYQQYANVNAPLMDIQNRTMMGNIANQRFQDTYGASQGDVKSLRRVLSNSYGDAVRESARLGQSQREVLETQRLGAGASVAGGTVNGALGFTPMGRVAGASASLSKAAQLAQGAGQGAQIGGSVAGSGSEFMRLGVDINRQISQSQIFGQGFNAMRTMQDTMSQIDDFSGQKGLNRFKSLGLATRGLGTGILTADMFNTRTVTGSGDIGSGRSTGIRDGNVITPVDEIRGNSDAVQELRRFGIDANDPGLRAQVNANVRKLSGEMDSQAAADMGISAEAYQDYKRGRRAEKSGMGFFGKAKEFFLGPSDADTERRIKLGQKVTATGQTVDTEQGVVDTGSGISTVVAEGGGRRESVLQRLMDPKLMRDLAQRGLGKEEDIARVVGTSVSMLGGAETERTLEGTLKRAGSFTQAGYFQSPEQYVQARSMMSSVGGNMENLDEALKVAVTAGLDSSKHIMEMVSGIHSVAQSSATAGIATAQGAMGSLGAAISSLDYLPENMRTAAALQSAQVGSQLTTSTDLTLGNMVESARLRSAIGPEGLAAMNDVDYRNLLKMSPDQYRQMVKEYKKGDDQGRKFMEESFGIDNIDKVIPNLATAEKIAEASYAGGILNTGAPFGDIEGFELSRRARSGEKLEGEDLKKLKLFNTRINRSVDTASATDAMDYRKEGAISEKAATTVDIVKETGSPGGLSKAAEDALAAPGVSDTNLSIEGMDQFKKAFGGLEAVGTNLLGISEKLKAADFAKQTKEAMDNLTAPTGVFSDTMKGLNDEMATFSLRMNDVIGKMEKGTSTGGGDSELLDKLDRLIDKLNKQQNNPMGGNSSGDKSKLGGF